MNRLKRQIISTLLLIALALGCVAVPAGAVELPFTDVPGDAYYYSAVAWALENEVTSGTSATTFSPAATCTRGQVVTFLWRAQGKPAPVTSRNGFRDVSEADYYYNAVLWAVENGITNGTSAATFSPAATCTTAQVLTFLWRAEGEPEPRSASTLAENYYGLYYEKAVAWADSYGMLSGMGSTAFDAAADCPRSDIVTYLYRYATADNASAPANEKAYTQLTPTSASAFDPASVPAYSGAAFVQFNGNSPYFSAENLTTDSYELYGALDSLGRCTACVACVGEDLMPTEERGSIGQVKPTGWHTVKYDCVDGKYLYNRSHLIGYQLSGENANTRNLITGTRYFNLNMLDYENLIAEYVEDHHAHVLYRVTPVFYGSNLLASGVLMEGMSVEDRGASVKFCVFMYNVQPGITIDYATGDSWETSDGAAATVSDTAGAGYVLNTNTLKFHYPSCSAVGRMNAEHKCVYSGTRAEILAMGYTPCGICKP